MRWIAGLLVLYMCAVVSACVPSRRAEWVPIDQTQARFGRNHKLTQHDLDTLPGQSTPGCSFAIVHVGWHGTLATLTVISLLGYFVAARRRRRLVVHSSGETLRDGPATLRGRITLREPEDNPPVEIRLFEHEKIKGHRNGRAVVTWMEVSRDTRVREFNLELRDGTRIHIKGRPESTVVRGLLTTVLSGRPLM